MVVKKLEDYRKENIGLVAVHHENRIIPVLYHNWATMAVNTSIGSLKNVENPSGDIMHSSEYDKLAVIMWFSTLENFISTILYIACAKFNKPYEQYKKKDLPEKVSRILDLSIVDRADRVEFNKETKILTQIREFCSVRNELLHRNHTENKLKIKHTMFYEIPFFLNLIDVMQSILICLNFFKIFSEIFHEAFLMPQIKVQINNTFTHIRLDEIYEFFVKPYFLECLRKHGLTTDLSLNTENTIYLKDKLPKIDILIQYANDLEPIGVQSRTGLSQFYWDRMVDRHFADDRPTLNKLVRNEIFKVPNYMRK